jgi:hypothetical protein
VLVERAMPKSASRRAPGALLEGDVLGLHVAMHDAAGVRERESAPATSRSTRSARSGASAPSRAIVSLERAAGDVLL